MLNPSSTGLLEFLVKIQLYYQTHASPFIVTCSSGYKNVVSMILTPWSGTLIRCIIYMYMYLYI